MNLPTPKELREQRLAEQRRRAFGPVALAALLRGQARRKARPQQKV